MLRRPQILSYARSQSPLGSLCSPMIVPRRNRFANTSLRRPRCSVRILTQSLEQPARQKWKTTQTNLLTLVLLCNKGIREEGKFDQFQFQTDRTPRPNELVGEVNRGLGGYPLFLPTAPVSMIHQDRITDITCEVKGNKATGVVSYQVPGMYFGKVKYIAEKTPTHWYITEADRFRLRHPPDPRRAGIVEREGVSSLVHFHLMSTINPKSHKKYLSQLCSILCG